MADNFLAEDVEDGKEKIKRAEILGFIGEDYQRFFIHFVSIIQNPTNHYEYLVYGKTKVKEAICSFQGKISVKKARTYINGDFPKYKQGFAAWRRSGFRSTKLYASTALDMKQNASFKH